MNKISVIFKGISMIWGCFFCLYGLIGACGISPGGKIEDPPVQFASLITALFGTCYFFTNSYIAQTKRRIKFFKVAYTLPIVLIIALSVMSSIINGYEEFMEGGLLTAACITLLLSSTPLLSLKYYNKTTPSTT